MKINQRFIWLAILLTITACGGGANDGTNSEPAVRTLDVGETQTQFISNEGEVDTYQIRAAEANRFLHLRCEEKNSGSNVDLLVTVFEEANGHRRRLFGKHKPDGATLGADLDLWIYIDTPKDLIITVRDLMDDESSPEIPYHLRATFEDAAEGNHDFSNAQPLTVSASAFDDAIDEIGEVDCFTFGVASEGVFEIFVNHYKPLGGTPVQLAVSLYDYNGNLIQRLSDPFHVLLAHLTPDGGPFFIIVEDSDSLNGDAGAPYDIAINSVAVSEIWKNDAADSATFLEADALDIYTTTGAIDYGCSNISVDNAGDMDWYHFTLGDIGGAATFHQIQLTIDDGETVNGTAPLRLVVYDTDMETITAQNFTPGGNAYQNQFRIQNGEYFFSVAPANAKRLDCSTAYRVQLAVSDSNDTVEATDDNTVNSAIDLAAGIPLEGRISYPSDVDWYSFSLDTTSSRILSVAVTAETSLIDYQLSLWRGDRMIKKVADLDGSDGTTQLRTSVLVPEDVFETTATYHIKICDAQNNEGSDGVYTIVTDSEPVAGNPGQIPQTAGKTPFYYSETDTEANETDEVELEIFSSFQPTFKSNATWLDFRDPLAQGISQTNPGDGTTVIFFPWICGYVDYQDDRDFFQINLDKLDPAGEETDWYYDVQIRMVVPSPGGEVEYVWKLYRDSNRNAIIMDDPTSPDGYKACAGDTTPLVEDTMDLTTPSGEETFWIGSEWGENANFYIGISDFNYLQLPDSNSLNNEPDNDWGYDAPYYFTITLTYHPGQPRPE